MLTYRKSDARKWTSTNYIAIIAVLIALRVVIGMLPSFKVEPYVQMGWGFIGSGVTASLFGPIISGFIGATLDVINYFMGGSSQPFFFGYTLSAFLGGVIYSIGLHNKEKTWQRIAVTVFVVTLVVNIGLGSLWIRMMTGKAWEVFMPLRIAKNAVSFPLNTFILTLILNNKQIAKLIERYKL